MCQCVCLFFFLFRYCWLSFLCTLFTLTKKKVYWLQNLSTLNLQCCNESNLIMFLSPSISNVRPGFYKIEVRFMFKIRTISKPKRKNTTNLFCTFIQFAGVSIIHSLRKNHSRTFTKK